MGDFVMPNITKQVILKREKLEKIIEKSKDDPARQKKAKDELRKLPIVRRVATDVLTIDNNSEIKTLEELYSKLSNLLPTVIEYQSKNKKMFLINLPEGYGVGSLYTYERLKYITYLRKKFFGRYGGLGCLDKK